MEKVIDSAGSVYFGYVDIYAPQKLTAWESVSAEEGEKYANLAYETKRSLPQKIAYRLSRCFKKKHPEERKIVYRSELRYTDTYYSEECAATKWRVTVGGIPMYGFPYNMEQMIPDGSRVDIILFLPGEKSWYSCNYQVALGMQKQSITTTHT